MSARHAVRRRLSIVAFAAGLSLVLAACGKTNVPFTGENNGVYVNAGPITYQLQISRELNQYATEDSQYLKGLPSGQHTLSANQEWYGVFLWAKNQTKEPQTTANNFDIIDTEGNKYYPVKVDPSVNLYAWTQERLGPGDTEPGPDTTGTYGPTQGALLLFKINTSVYDNRPLTLQIRGGQSQKVWGSIALDL